MTTTETAIMTPARLLDHWLGHRRLTRRAIQAFPDEQLYSFTPAPPMRSFGMMMNEVAGMVKPSLEGMISGVWSTTLEYQDLADKASLLRAHDETDAFIRETWPRIPAERFTAVEATYFSEPAPLVDIVLYLIDNEVHHRAQGFVYLRQLGIEPPVFYVRD